MTQTIYDLMKSKGFGYRSLSRAVGVHENTIRYWIKSPSGISHLDALRLADVLGVSVDEISFDATDNT